MKTAKRFAVAALALALIAAVVALATRALWRSPRPATTDDATSTLLAEFDANVRSGNFVPVWAPRLGKGYGSPDLEFHPPLAPYATSGVKALLAAGSPSARDRLPPETIVALGFAALGALGFFLLARRLPGAGAFWAPLAASVGYALCPWTRHALSPPVDLAGLAGEALLPWLGLAFAALARRPTTARAAIAAAAFALLALAHETLAPLAACAVALACLLRPRRLRPRFALAAAVALGLGAVASCFHWLPAYAELVFVKNALRLGDPAKSPPGFSVAPAIYATGALGMLGVCWAIVRWAGAGPALAWRRGPKATWSLAVDLLGFLMMCAALTLVPWDELAAPRTALPAVRFFAILLGTLALTLELSKPWHWAVALAALTATAALPAYPVRAAAASREGAFDGAAYLTPATAALAPATHAESLLAFTQGRGEGTCARPGPTRLECEIMAVHASTVRFHVLDYPEWRATVDGKPGEAGRDPRGGMPTLRLTPGKHLVTWELRDTRLRAGAKWASLVAWLMIALLLFQDQLVKRKALAPKRV